MVSATTESTLTEAQCNFGAAQECFATFDACLAADGADEAACREALHGCLPPPPERPEGMEGGCPGMGDREGDRPPPPPPLPDGGLPPPPPREGDRHPPPNPECRAALEACLASGTEEPRHCFEAEHRCVGDALRQNFQLRCDAAAAECEGSTDELCARILARCAEGIEARPQRCGGGEEAEVIPVTE